MRTTSLWIFLTVACFAWLAAACNPPQKSEQEPTFTLVPPTATPTPLLPTLTPTPQPAPTSLLNSLPPQPTIPVPEMLPVGVTAIVDAVLADGETVLQAPRLLGLKAVLWNSTELDCDDV